MLTPNVCVKLCYMTVATLGLEHLLSPLWCIHPGGNGWVLLALGMLITTELSAPTPLFRHKKTGVPARFLTCLSPEVQVESRGERCHCPVTSREVLPDPPSLRHKTAGFPNRFTWRPNLLPQEQSLCFLIIVSPNRKKTMSEEFFPRERITDGLVQKQYFH